MGAVGDFCYKDKNWLVNQPVKKMQQFYSLGGAHCIANYDAVHYYLHQGQKNAVKIAAQLAV